MVFRPDETNSSANIDNIFISDISQINEIEFSMWLMEAGNIFLGFPWDSGYVPGGFLLPGVSTNEWTLCYGYG